MAYKLQRVKRLIEDIELCDAEGNVVKTIHVDLDIETMAMQINKARNELIRIEKMINNQPKVEDLNLDKSMDLWEDYGNAFILLLGLIFGEKNTESILDHYENRLGELVTEITPFIQEVVFPALREAQERRNKRLRHNYRPKGGFFRS